MSFPIRELRSVWFGLAILLLASSASAQEVICRDKDGEFLATRACPPGATLVRQSAASKSDKNTLEAPGERATGNNRSSSTAAVCRNERGTIVLAAECDKSEQTIRAGDSERANAMVAGERVQNQKNWCATSAETLSAQKNSGLMSKYLKDCVRPEDAKRTEAMFEKRQEEAAEREKMARIKAVEERAAKAEQAAKDAQQAAANASSEAEKANQRAADAERVAGQDLYFPPAVKPIQPAKPKPTPAPKPKPTPKPTPLPTLPDR